jgi:hypothetical protein
LQRSLQQRRALAGSNQTNESVAESYNNLVWFKIFLFLLKQW